MSLTQLGYTIQNDGFVFCNDESQTKNKVEWLYLKESEKFPVKPSAIFFRRFYKNNESEKPYHSEPAVCIFDVEDNFFNSELHKQLHAALWSAGRNEIYVIRDSSRLDILNARKPASKIPNENDVTLDDENLLLVKKSLENYDAFKYSTHLFQSGLFWEQDDFKTRIEGNSSPYEFLLVHLMEARKKIHHEAIKHQLSKKTVDKLLIISILVKFLEEIKVDKNKHTLNEIYQKHQIQSFAKAIENRKIFNILDELAGEFNGKVFNQFTEAEKAQIQKVDLKSLAQFLTADIDIPTQQLFIWKQYDFKFLPAEVISSIYENFTGEGEKGVVYTPIHLVNLMIDEVMPLDNATLFENEKFKVLDPSCGSGVFLVAAYKRLLQWWFINNEKPIDSETAKRILEENIFGVDIEETAVLVSIFGLTTTLLDQLSPKEIWNNLKFKDLSKDNIQKSNFKDWINNHKKNKEKYFDLIIGNPPFNASSKGTITAKEFKTLLNKTVPGNKLALMFLESALYFGKKVCMIIPSNIFLYNKSSTNQAYRERIFTDYTVEKIYDFTHLRRVLFHKTADTPVLSIIINNQPSAYQPIEHIVVKREFQSEQKMRFEIDDYDRHLVPWQHTVDENVHFVWKTNLLGGGQLFHLIYRLSLLQRLRDFIEKKRLNNQEWLYSSGYKIGGKTKKIKADYIYNKPSINVKKGFDYKKGSFFIEKESASEFEAPRNENLYCPPVLVISEILGEGIIPIQLFNTYQTFNISLVGIHAPFQKENELIGIYDYFKEFNDTFQLYIIATSAKVLINKETAFIKSDLDNLPFPDNKDYFELTSFEHKIQTDILQAYRHFGKSIYNDGKILHRLITKKDPQLLQFGKTYCDAMNEIYETKTQNWQVGTVTQTPNFTIYRIGFGNKNGLKYKYEKETTEAIFSNLIYNDLQNAGVRFTRVVRYYKHESSYDFVYFIKPNARKYWLNSIALRDAGKTYMDLKNNGY